MIKRETPYKKVRVRGFNRTVRVFNRTHSICFVIVFSTIKASKIVEPLGWSDLLRTVHSGDRLLGSRTATSIRTLKRKRIRGPPNIERCAFESHHEVKRYKKFLTLHTNYFFCGLDDLSVKKAEINQDN
jgi:hypothetical protein